MSRPFEARYDGWCGSCLERILEGDEVIYEDDEVVHLGCATPRLDDSDLFDG